MFPFLAQWFFWIVGRPNKELKKRCEKEYTYIFYTYTYYLVLKLHSAFNFTRLNFVLKTNTFTIHILSTYLLFVTLLTIAEIDIFLRWLFPKSFGITNRSMYPSASHCSEHEIIHLLKKRYFIFFLNISTIYLSL